MSSEPASSEAVKATKPRRVRPSKNPLTAQQVSQRASAAALRLHATRDGREVTAAARAASMGRFAREVDPEGVLPEKERARRAELAKRAFFIEMAFKSSRVRSGRAAAAERERTAKKGAGRPTSSAASAGSAS